MNHFNYANFPDGVPLCEVTTADVDDHEHITDIHAGPKELVTDRQFNNFEDVDRPRVIEIKSDDVITFEPEEDLDQKVKDSRRKWSHRANLKFFEAFKIALTSKHRGNFITRKALMQKAMDHLRNNGIDISYLEVERKYNNMLATYKRCRRKYHHKKKIPSWPYFEMMKTINHKVNLLTCSDLEGYYESIQVPSPPIDEAASSSFSVLTSISSSSSYKPATNILALSRKWQIQRNKQEKQKIDIISSLILSAKASRAFENGYNVSVTSARLRENRRLAHLRKELNRGQSCIKEISFINQDVYCLASACDSGNT